MYGAVLETRPAFGTKVDIYPLPTEPHGHRQHRSYGSHHTDDHTIPKNLGWLTRDALVDRWHVSSGTPSGTHQ